MTLERPEDITLPPDLCQRWRERRDSYRPVREVEDVSRLVVDAMEELPAKRFVEEHHYSASYPAARVRVGLYRDARLVGVAVFAEPAQRATIPRWAPGVSLGVVLSRFVLLDEIGANAETWFLARAFRVLRRELPDVGAVVSYADPVRRRDATGRLVLPGHVGTIYQAFNGRYLGRSKPETVLLAPDGTAVDRRGLSKVRNGERGAGAVVRRLLELGAPARGPFEDEGAWLRRVMGEGPFRRLRHPGKHVYAWAIGGAALGPEIRPRPRGLSCAPGEQLSLPGLAA